MGMCAFTSPGTGGLTTSRKPSVPKLAVGFMNHGIRQLKHLLDLGLQPGHPSKATKLPGLASMIPPVKESK